MRSIKLDTKKPKWKGWIIKAFLSAVWLVLLTEGAARLVFSINPPPQWVGGLDDSSFRIGWIKRHRTREVVADFLFTIYHPTRGWALRPAVKDLRVFDAKVLNTNSKGLRGRTEYAYCHHPGKRRIVLLGDSFTFGTDVSDEETYAHILGGLLPNTEVLNLGVHAYGHDQMLLYLKEEGAKYQPDVVLLGFVWVDIYRNLWTFDSFAKPKFELRRDGLHLTHVPVPTPDLVLAQEPYRPKALDLMLILREKLLWSFEVNERRARDLTRLLFDEIVATTRSIGAVPVFVYLPIYEEVFISSDTMTAREQYLHGYCQDRGVACLFLRPRFKQEIKEGAKFNTQGHWNVEVHRAAAQGIKDFLLGMGLIQEPSRSRKKPGFRRAR